MLQDIANVARVIDALAVVVARRSHPPLCGEASAAPTTIGPRRQLQRDQPLDLLSRDGVA